MGIYVKTPFWLWLTCFAAKIQLTHNDMFQKKKCVGTKTTKIYQIYIVVNQQIPLILQLKIFKKKNTFVNDLKLLLERHSHSHPMQEDATWGRPKLQSTFAVTLLAWILQNVTFWNIGKVFGFQKTMPPYSSYGLISVFVGWKLPRESSDFRWFWGTGALVEVHANCIILEQKTENTDESCALANFHKKSLNQTSKNPSFPHLSYKFNDISRAIFCGDFLFKKTSILSQQALSSRLLDMSTEAALHIAMSSQGFLDMTSHQAATPWTWLWGFFCYTVKKSSNIFVGEGRGSCSVGSFFWHFLRQLSFLFVVVGNSWLSTKNWSQTKSHTKWNIVEHVRHSYFWHRCLFPPPFLSSLVWRPRKPFLVESSTGLNLGTARLRRREPSAANCFWYEAKRPSDIQRIEEHEADLQNPWYEADQQFFRKNEHEIWSLWITWRCVVKTMWILESFKWNLVHLRSIPCCIWPWKHQASLPTCWSGICATALFFCVRKGYPATSISFQSQSFQRQRSAKYAKQHETHIFSGGDSVFLESSFSGSMTSS